VTQIKVFHFRPTEQPLEFLKCFCTESSISGTSIPVWPSSVRQILRKKRILKNAYYLYFVSLSKMPLPFQTPYLCGEYIAGRGETICSPYNYLFDVFATRCAVHSTWKTSSFCARFSRSGSAFKNNFHCFLFWFKFFCDFSRYRGYFLREWNEAWVRCNCCKVIRSCQWDEGEFDLIFVCR